MRRCSSAQGTRGGDVALGYIATILTILLTFAPREKSPACLTSFAGQWPNNIGCWYYHCLPVFRGRSGIVADLPFGCFGRWHHEPCFHSDNRGLRHHSSSEVQTHRTRFKMNDTTWQRLFG